MSDHTLIALSREVAALTQARDRLQQENETLKQELQAAHWDSDAATFRAEEYYRQLQALDAAASHLPNLRETLGRYLDGATLLRQREPRLILQDLFALIHDYDKAALPAPPAASSREEEP